MNRKQQTFRDGDEEMKIKVNNYKSSLSCVEKLFEVLNDYAGTQRFRKIELYISWVDEKGNNCVPTEYGLPLEYTYKIIRYKNVKADQTPVTPAPLKRKLSHGTSLAVLVKKNEDIDRRDMAWILDDVEKRISSVINVSVSAITFYVSPI